MILNPHRKSLSKSRIVRHPGLYYLQLKRLKRVSQLILTFVYLRQEKHCALVVVFSSHCQNEFMPVFVYSGNRRNNAPSRLMDDKSRKFNASVWPFHLCRLEFWAYFRNAGYQILFYRQFRCDAPVSSQKCPNYLI
jgi:hypothetical protein